MGHQQDTTGRQHDTTEHRRGLARPPELLYGSDIPMALCPRLPHEFAKEHERNDLNSADIGSCKDLEVCDYGALSWYMAVVWEYAWNTLCNRHYDIIDRREEVTEGDFNWMMYEDPSLRCELAEYLARGLTVLEKVSRMPLGEMPQYAQHLRSGDYYEDYHDEARLIERYHEFVEKNIKNVDERFVPGRRENILGRNDVEQAKFNPLRMAGLMMEGFVWSYMEFFWGAKVVKDGVRDGRQGIDATVTLPDGRPVAMSIKMGARRYSRRITVRGERGATMPKVEVNLGLQVGEWPDYFAEWMLYLKNASLFELPPRREIDWALSEAMGCGTIRK